MALPQGWKQKSGEALLYQASFPNFQKGESGTTSLNVTTNKATGNYDVYQPGFFGDTLIYQYNASTDTKVVKNKAIYDQIFRGNLTRLGQLESLDRRVRANTYQIAVDQVVGGQNSITSQELAALKAKPGYKMYGTTIDIAPPADPQGGNPTPTQQKLTGFEPGLDLAGDLKPVEDTPQTGQNSGGSTGAPVPSGPAPVLRYPLANLDAAGQFGISYDYIKIKVVDYVPSLKGAGIGGVLNAPSATERYDQNSQALAYVILPMQPGINEANGVSWGQDSMNILQLLAASFTNQYFAGISGDQGAIDSAKRSFEELTRSFNSLKAAGTVSQQEIAALLAGFVTNTNVIQRTTGSVINPNMELLFTGPKMRVFSFNFEMTPRFEEEAEVIRKIIKTFKKYMAPEVKTGNAFLKTPKIFQLEYIYNGDGSPEGQGTQHPYLNKIKPCALMDFQVNYTPDGTYMTYRGGGSMTRYTLQMTFAEVEPIYQGDQDLSSNDMGY